MPMRNQFEEQARLTKCRKTVNHMLLRLADLAEKPENADMVTNAALEAGCTEPSEASRKMIVEMIREMAK